MNCSDFLCDNGDCTDCQSDPIGACCVSTTECSVTTEADCGGTWTAGASCSVDLCGGGGDFESYVIDLAGHQSPPEDRVKFADRIGLGPCEGEGNEPTKGQARGKLR